MAGVDFDQLQQVALRNSGQQDAQIANSNQRFVNPITPTPEWLTANTGPAATSTTNTQTFGVNRPAPSTDDLINQAIDQRRLQISQHIDPDAPARFINPKRANELNHEMSDLSNIRVQSAHFQLQQAQQRHEQDTAIRAGTDLAGMLNEVNDLHNSGVSPGTPQFEKGLIGIYARHPDGARTELGESIFRKNAAIHDNEVDKRKRIDAYHNVSRLAEQLGTNPVFGEDGTPDYNATMDAAIGKYGQPYVTAVMSGIKPAKEADSDKSFSKRFPGLTPDDFKHPNAAQIVRLEAQPDGTVKPVPDSSGGTVKMQDTKGQPHYIDIRDYRENGGTLSPQDAAVQTPEEASPSAGEAKPLDADAAKALLKEAGGDKDKARKLAKERGYSF